VSWYPEHDALLDAMYLMNGLHVALMCDPFGTLDMFLSFHLDIMVHVYHIVTQLSWLITLC
jgi:hypothetical protein